MSWPDALQKELDNALLVAYPQPEDLRPLVRYDLHTNLEDITQGSGRKIIFDLIQWAAAHNQLEALLQAALEFNPNNPELKQLAAKVSNQTATPAAEDGTSPGQWTWAAVLAKAQAQASSPETVPFYPYVGRTIGFWLDAFLVSSEVGFILTGEMGAGKTMLLRHWAGEIAADGHAVFFYNSAQLHNVSVENQVAQDLGLANAASLVATLQQIGQSSDGRQLVLIFDAVDQFDIQDNQGPKDLLTSIDAFVRKIQGNGIQAVRVVLSSTQTAWERLINIWNIRLTWSNYYQPQDSASAASPVSSAMLGLYDREEQEKAYANYRRHYADLPDFTQLPQNLRDALLSPLIMRLMADSYGTRPDLWAAADVPVSIYRCYYQSLIRANDPDQAVIAALVSEMQDEKRSAISLLNWRNSNPIVANWLDNSPYSPYYHLLDIGILTEGVETGKRLVRFSESWMGPHALALTMQNTWEQTKADTRRKTQDIADLAREAGSFAFAWDTARILLTLTREPEILSTLVTPVVMSPPSPDPLTDAIDPVEQNIGLRELVSESLVAIYAEDPKTAQALIQALLLQPSTDAQQVALKAMYRIGFGMQPVFRAAIENDTPEESGSLRTILHNTLYLLWKSDPTFVYDLLESLIEKVDPSTVLTPKTQKLLEFVIRLAAVIYMNHPDDEDVQTRVTQLYYNLAVNHLDLDHATAQTGTVFWATLGQYLIAPTLTTLLLETVNPYQDVFALPPEARAPFRTVVARLLNPDTPLDAAALAQLEPLLNSEILLFNIMAAHTIPIHLGNPGPDIIEQITALFGRLNQRGRLALLFGFSLLTPTCPAAWIAVLELFTRRLIDDQEAHVFYGESPDILNRFDTLLLPLGLAYSNAREDLLYFHELLRNQIQTRAWDKLGRVLKGLAALGFYDPDAVFALLEQRIKRAYPEFVQRRTDQLDLNQEERQLLKALLPLLGSLHILHFDAVDKFLQQLCLGSDYARKVRVAAGIGDLPRFIDIVGLYNQIIYHCIHYPQLREGLSVKVLNALADKPDEEAFRAECNAIVGNLFKSVGYDMRQLFN